MVPPCAHNVRLAESAQAPATAADSLGTTPGTAPRVAKVEAVGGGDVAEVAEAAAGGAEAKADADQTTKSSPTMGMLRLLRVAAMDIPRDQRSCRVHPRGSLPASFQ